MIVYLLENPWPIALIGAVVAASSGYAWLQTGHPMAFRLAVGSVVLGIVMVAVSLWIKTDREHVIHFLSETAGELERNEYDKVIAKIHPQASGELLDARSQLPSIQFISARVKTIHSLEISSNRIGRTAVVQFNAYVEAEQQGYRRSAPRWVQLSLEESDGRWMVVALEQRAPHFGLLNESGRQRFESLGR